VTVVVSPPADATPLEAVTRVEMQMNQLPDADLGARFPLTYLCEDAEVVAELRGLPKPQLIINCRGQPAQIVDEGARRWRMALRTPIRFYGSPEARIPTPLYLNVYLMNGRLRFDWTYSDSYFDSTIHDLMTAQYDRLRELVGGSTPPGCTTP
jgi:hypothetical protein